MGQQPHRSAARVSFLFIAVVLAGFATPAHAIVLPIVNRPVLKEYFEKGDKPTQPQFATLIDSMAIYIDDRHIIGLRQYNPTQIYIAGGTALALKRFDAGDTIPEGPAGYLNPATTPYELEPDFAGHSGFLAFEAADSTGSDIYYGYLQIQMDAAGGSATLSADDVNALAADPPAINVEYVVYNTTPNTPFTFAAVPEPTGAAVFLFAAALLRRRRSQNHSC